MRHEIRPGYLLSHAPASRLPSDSTELPCAGARLQHARTQARAARRGAANVQAAHTSREQVCMTGSHLSSTQTQMNTSVSMFSHKAQSDQSQSHGCVFNSPCFKTKSEFHNLFLLDCYAEISDRGQIYLSGRLSGALLGRTAGCLIMVNFSSGLR